MRPLLCLLLIAACSEGTAPGVGYPLFLLPAVDTVPVDSSVQLRAVQVLEEGDTVEVPEVLWISRDPDLATVSETGTVTGSQSGRVTIVALVDDRRATAQVRVERRFRAVDVAVGGAGVCAVDLDGRIWCQSGWGSGVIYPQPDTTDIRTFQLPVSGPERYAVVGSNVSFFCGLDTSGQARCWGPQPLRGLSAAVPVPIAPGLTFDTLSVHGPMGCGLAAGIAHCWGSEVSETREVDTGGLLLNSLDVQAEDACGFTRDGRQLCWTLFSPAGPDIRRITPPATPGAPGLRGLVNGGDHFCGLETGGLAWCWGANAEGQLGNGTTLDSPGLVRVATSLEFTRLAADPTGDARLVCGIGEDHGLFCWGAGFGSVPAAVLY